MNTLNVILIITLLTASPEYDLIFDSDYKEALAFVKKNKVAFIEKSAEYHTDTSIVISTIFPELIRYSIFKDFFETKALELVYIELGSEYADFSIGRFQMKPSFIEKMEDFVKNSQLNSKPQFTKIYYYNCNDTVQIRKLRIERLKSLEWQIVYVNCFYSIVNHKFKSVEQKSVNDKIRFYATVYNYGFDKDADAIKKWIDVKVFPYGVKNSLASKFIEQYSYSDISMFFFRNDYKSVFIRQE